METEKKTPGYLLTYIMDYGNGRQLQINGNLPVEASEEDFDRELDKLREATNRQQAMVILRDTKAKLNAEKKMAAALRLMVDEYEKTLEQEMERLAKESAKHSTGKQRSQVTSTIDNMRTQGMNYKQNKMEEIQRHETNCTIYETTISSIESEYGLASKSGG